jgi:multidrug efflux pump subunit AcrA (membrane-fusion protein)
MLNNENISPSEKLLRTDLKELLGGKTTLPPEFLAPPPIKPPVFTGDNDGHNEKLPELRSEAVNEIMTTPPKWLVRWGITVFCIILVALLFISNMVAYPDLIKGNMVIVSVNYPKSVVAKTDGKLLYLYTQEGEQVNSNEVLGLIESTADYQEVLSLEQEVNRLLSIAETGNVEQVNKANPPLFFQLGELQKSYQAFHDNLIRTKAFLTNGAYRSKKSVLNNDLGTMTNIDQNLKNQLKLLESEMALASEQLATQKRLAAKGFVAEKDVQAANSTFLSKKQSYEQAKNSIENGKLSYNQKSYEIVDIDRQIVEQKNSLIQSITTLKSEIEQWKQRYLLRSPASGKVTFISSIQENVQLKAGQELFYVQPEGEGFYGEIKLGQYNLGKVVNKQEVLVKVTSYPYQEFGIVRGTINQIAELPKDSLYTVKVNFPDLLKTDSQYEIPFKNGMTATAEIVTEELSLLDRFFSEVRRVVK